MITQRGLAMAVLFGALALPLVAFATVITRRLLCAAGYHRWGPGYQTYPPPRREKTDDVAEWRCDCRRRDCHAFQRFTVFKMPPMIIPARPGSYDKWGERQGTYDPRRMEEFIDRAAAEFKALPPEERDRLLKGNWTPPDESPRNADWGGAYPPPV